jgi:hypothetical protein
MTDYARTDADDGVLGPSRPDRAGQVHAFNLRCKTSKDDFKNFD